MAVHNASPTAAMVVALALGACAPSAPTPAENPAVLVVVADSLHARHLGAWGGERATSPGLDALAAQGLRFEQAYSQSSWTLASVATLFTSLEQERHGLRTLEQVLPDEPSTLAELFAAAGWETHAIVQTPVLASARGLRRGFERYEVLPFGNEASEDALERAARGFEHAAGRPLFLYLHLAPPHMPYQPPAPFAGRFSAALEGDPSVDGSIAACRGVHELGLASDHPDVVRLAALYDEHVAYADDCVGRLLERIAELDPTRDLLVIVTSDHGEAFMEHGAQGHNAQVHEEMLHVPLVILGRGGLNVPAGVVRQPVSLLDLLPTLVELLELPAPRQVPQGRSLAAALRGEPLELPARALLFSSRYKRHPADIQLGLREGDLKLVLLADGERVGLYDLARDPLELQDLSAELPEQVERMTRRLRDWYAARRPDAPSAGADPAQAAALRALGYAGDD